MKKPRNPHTKRVIFNHWAPILAEMGVFIEDGVCFACGGAGSLERAHIEPRAITQDDSVGNLHLLCGRCHHDSEYLDSRDDYFAWLKSRSPIDGLLSKMQASLGLSPAGLVRDGWSEVARTALRAMNAGRLKEDPDLARLCRQVIAASSG